MEGLVQVCKRKTNAWLVRVLQNYPIWGEGYMPIHFYTSREDYEERYGEEVGTCNRHKVMVVDRSCDLCFDEIAEAEDRWICNECGEVKYDDARVEANMKCGECAYG